MVPWCYYDGSITVYYAFESNEFLLQVSVHMCCSCVRLIHFRQGMRVPGGLLEV